MVSLLYCFNQSIERDHIHHHYYRCHQHGINRIVKSQTTMTSTTTVSSVDTPYHRKRKKDITTSMTISNK